MADRLESIGQTGRLSGSVCFPGLGFFTSSNGTSIMRMLLIDDHAIFRRGLRTLLSDVYPQIHIDEAESIEQVMSPDTSTPDLILLDINLPGVSGLDGIALLRQRWSTTRIVMLSALATHEASIEALTNGATGYLSKTDSPEQILKGVTAAMNGRTPNVYVLANGLLTPRQRDVITLLGEGLSNKLIAQKFNLSENTVRRHVQDILDHFQVDSRAEAVFAARKRGLLK